MPTRVLGLQPFVPSGPHFETALAFFAAVGFEVTWRDGDYAGLRRDDAAFILQRIDQPQWAQNQMLVLEVADLDAAWTELSAAGLERRFPGVRLRPPTEFAWGREIHLIDPAGVCWHLRQSAAPPPQA